MPIIFAGNHNNGLVDPLVVYVTVNRKRLIRPVAAAYLFQIPIVGWVLRHVLLAIPVVRRGDSYTPDEYMSTSTSSLFSSSAVAASVAAPSPTTASMVPEEDEENGIGHRNNHSGEGGEGGVEQWRQTRNSTSLEAMANVLVNSDSFCIFPEGTSHNEPELLELKTGYARACMMALQEKPSLRVAIVPVGLNYEAKNEFRSDIFVEYGKPLIVTNQLVQQWCSQHPNEDFVTHLTEMLKERLENVIIHAPNLRILNGAHLARMIIYTNKDLDQMTQEEYIDTTKEIIRVLRMDNETSRQLCDDLATFQTHLDILGLTYKELKKGTSSLILSLLISILSMPLSLPGALFHAPIGLLASFLGKKVAQGYQDQQAHYKIMVTMMLVPIVYFITFLLLFIRYGFWISIGVLLLLILSILFAIMVRPLGCSIEFLRIFPRLVTFNRRAFKREHDRLREKLLQLL